MAHYANVSNGVVMQVITADEDFFLSFNDGSPGEWLATDVDGGARKNYAGIGFTYDSVRDAFIAPQPYPSWTLVEDTYLWESPVVYPADGSIDKRYTWDEDTTNWVEVPD